jgi:hypothetical protein
MRLYLAARDPHGQGGANYLIVQVKRRGGVLPVQASSSDPKEQDDHDRCDDYSDVSDPDFHFLESTASLAWIPEEGRAAMGKIGIPELILFTILVAGVWYLTRETMKR